jgi:hypothetical protein
MIRRPINARFASAVRRGEKTTTIREKAWPVGVPIMFYAWTGAAYRSQQREICPVIVTETTPISITRPVRGHVWYSLDLDLLRGRALWQTEGFASQEDMDDWFTATIKPGRCVERHLMLFQRWSP